MVEDQNTLFAAPHPRGHLLDMALVAPRASDRDGGTGHEEILACVSHRPFALPDRPWTMTQRWNDLLFAHWRVPLATMRALVPDSLELDTFDTSAWAAVVPFWMDRIRARVPGTAQASFGFPTMDSFPELNLRTYVRSRKTGRAGVYFFALEAANPLAVAGARALFHLPYFLARMTRETGSDGSVRYISRRLLTQASVQFDASYRGLGRAIDSRPSLPGSIEHFLTERYCLFTAVRGRVLVGDIHHLPWPLEPAEADFRLNELPQAHGLVLPGEPPLLHFSRSLQVYVWPLRADGFV